MKIELGQFGSGGLIEDIKAFDLPPNIFTDTLNMEFNGFVIKPLVREIPALAALPETRFPIAAIQGFVQGGVYVYLAACEDSVWLWYMESWYDVTPADLRDTTTWTLFTFNGYVILNSPNNIPYYFNPFDFHKPLEVIPSWPEGLETSYLFAYNGFLVGLGLTSSDGYFDQQVIFWSDLAELGSLPANFSFSDPSSRAGFTTLADSEAFITAVELQNSIVIYRENSIYTMRFVGGNAIFAFERKLRNTSLLNKNCVVEVDSMHFFIGKDGFYMFDGFRAVAMGEGQISQTFFQNLDKTKTDLVAVQLDANLRRIFIYYSIGDVSSANYAYVYALDQRLFYKREVPGVRAFTAGVIPPTGNLVAWEDAIGTWTDYAGIWEIYLRDSRLSKVLWFSDNLVYQLPNDGAYMEGYVRRVDAAFAQQDQAGTQTVNRSLNKLVTKAWPELNAGSVNVTIGGALTTASPYTWLPSQLFVTETDLFQNWILNSKYIAYEFNNINPDGEGDPLYFELTGLALEIQSRGTY